MVRAAAIAPEPIASFRAVDVRGSEGRSAFSWSDRDETAARKDPALLRVIATGDQESLTAIHKFLRFQIEEHKTADPTAVK